MCICGTDSQREDFHHGASNESIDLAVSADWASAVSGEGPEGEPGPPGTLGREWPIWVIRESKRTFIRPLTRSRIGSPFFSKNCGEEEMPCSSAS